MSMKYQGIVNGETIFFDEWIIFRCGYLLWVVALIVVARACQQSTYAILEAGGFEPPSRDISGRVSTCLVVYLIFARVAAKRQAYTFAISRLNSPFASRTPASAIPLFDAPDRPAGKSPPGRAAQFRQPFATVCCQVKLSCRIFNQANRHPGHATRPSTCPVEAIRPLIQFCKEPVYYTISVRHMQRSNRLD